MKMVKCQKNRQPTYLYKKRTPLNTVAKTGSAVFWPQSGVLVFSSATPHRPRDLPIMLAWGGVTLYSVLCMVCAMQRKYTHIPHSISLNSSTEGYMFTFGSITGTGPNHGCMVLPCEPYRILPSWLRASIMAI